MPVSMKRTIAEAFLTLARQKAVDKITVKDLVEECHISRQTFYYHFQDLLEVLEWTFQQMTQQTLERSLRADTPQAALRAFFEGAMEHRALIDKLLHSQKWEQTQGLSSRPSTPVWKSFSGCAARIPGCPMPIWTSCWNSIPLEWPVSC